ncbi:hypothetical protein Tco_1108065 [Tanacetum coccineum]
MKKNPINLFKSSSTPSAEPMEYELKYQLYEKMFQTTSYLNHDVHHDLKMLKNQDKNKRKKFIMMHSMDSMLIGSSNRCCLTMTDRIDWTNPEGDRFHTDLSKPLPPEGPPGRKTIPTRFFFNKDLEYLMHGNEEKKYLKEIVVKRVYQKEYTFLETNFRRLNQNNIEDLYLFKIQDKIHNLVGIDEFDLKNSLLLYIRRIVIKKRVEDAQLGQKMPTRADEIHKFSDGTLNKVYDKLDVMLRDNILGYRNEGMKDHELTKKDKERTTSIQENIEKTLKERQRMRRLECFVGGRRNKIDYRLLVRTE